MKRELSINLVVLPQFDAYAGMSIIRGILTRVDSVKAELHKEKKKLPALVQAAVARLEKIYTELQHAVAQQKSQPVTREPREVHFEVTNAWGALHDWLLSFSRLTGEPVEKEQAAVVYERLFTDGLTFLKLKYPQCWAAGESKLVAAGEGNLEDVATALGGKVFFDQLQAIHKEYGLVLGVTKAQETQEEPTSLGTVLNEARSALRTFVMRVSGHVDDEDPTSQTQADYLLAPLMDFEGNARTTTEDTTDSPDGNQKTTTATTPADSGSQAAADKSKALDDKKPDQKTDQKIDKKTDKKTEEKVDKKAAAAPNGHDSSTGNPANH